MQDEHIGRLESVGLGIEATAGTAVAPQVYVRHLKNGIQRQATKLENTSAMGRVEAVNDSATSKVWSEGSIEGKVADISVGYFLYNLIGPPVTTDHADSNAAVKTHTYDVLQNNIPSYLTVGVINPVASRRHALAVVDEFEIKSEAGEWVTFAAGVKAKDGVAASDTAVYVEETEFTGKDTSIKLASNVAGLGAAPALDASSLTLKIERKSEPHFALGSTAPNSMSTGAFRATGEFVIRYNSTDYEDDWIDNTKQALQIKFENSAVTIGAAAHPSLTFTGPQARLTTFQKSDDLDEIVTATVGFAFELSTADAYALRAVLVNTYVAYEAA